MYRFRRLKLPSGQGRTVIENFGYLTILQIAGYAFPLITVPYLARVIGAEGFGKIAFATAIMTWVQTITDWGFNFTATRDVAQHRDEKDVVSEIFSNVLWARILLCMVSGMALVALVATIPTFRENADVIFVSFAMIPGHICFPEWFFQAIERMKYITVINLLMKFIFLLLVFVFIKEQQDYIYQPALISASYIICGSGALWIIVHKWGYRLRRPNLKQVFTTIKASTDVFLNNLFPNLYNGLSVILLGFWGGSIANGVYEGGQKFVSIFRQLHQVISRVFFPFLSRRPDRHHFFAVINIATAAAGAVLLAAFAPAIVYVMLGESFSDSILLMRILSVSLVFLAISDTYGTNYLILKHQEKRLRQCTMMISAIGLIVAIPLIKVYTELGVAIVVLLCRALIGLSTFALAIQYKKASKSGIA